MENEQKSQLELANEALVSISDKVTTEDREAAKSKYSDFTIVQYLKGRGKNLDTAMALLKLFNQRIEDRDKILAGHIDNQS